MPLGSRAKDVVDWILEEQALEGRLMRIRAFLENEGYHLPPPPKNVDRSEEGAIHIVQGRCMAVEYAVIDRGGRKVYHYRENEVDHIMLRRIQRGEEWALERLSAIPRILVTGKVVAQESDRVIYRSRQRYVSPTGEKCFLTVIIRRTWQGAWYIATFYPSYSRG
ncbi:MAG: hypothetical protein ACUVV0_00630 [Anaerolineae bacterium]